MILNPINLTTGPVALPSQVKSALAEQPVSHRSPEFEKIFRESTEFLSNHFHAREVYFLTGSGTLANETMLCQIRMLNKKGLILSNGEFGNRLIKQAEIYNLDFDRHIKLWGKEFNDSEIEKIIVENRPGWILFCHCETSTGILNNIDSISKIAGRHNCLCFIDCISSAGSLPINLSNVAMATASSGKGFCSLAGIGIVFSNFRVTSDGTIPTYLDLKYYATKNKIPFTISSNLINALYLGCKIKLTE